VLPFLKALMSLSGEDDFEEEEHAFDVHQVGDGDFHENDINQDRYDYSQTQSNQFRMQANKNAFALMDGRPMNAEFGDPCPGTTKLLRVEYLFRDYFHHDREVFDNATVGDIDECNVTNNGGDSSGNHGRRRQHHFHCTTSRKFQSTFREHERVLLKRQDPLFRLITDTDHTPSNVAEEQQQHQTNMEMKSSNGGSENAMQIDDAPGLISITSSSSTPKASSSSLPQIQSKLHSSYPPLPISSSSSPSKQWRLAPTTSDITLPIILPFLTVRQRAKCQIVCSSWRDIVLEKGIAVVVDVNDVGLFPKDQMNFTPTTASTRLSIPHHPATNSTNTNSSSPISSPIQNHPSRSLLRGLLNHSHSSLEALVLNDFTPLQPVIDLHPALPYLRKLKRLDISRIPSITDDTLHLISTFIGERLEVLYMKGLRNVTNDGVVRLVQSCSNLRVLDVSNVYQLEDEAGIAIGRHLTKLEVFNGRDNHKLTNQSVDLITRNCSLIQGTFWGCIRLTHVCFHDGQPAEKDATNSSLQSADNSSAMPRPAMPRPSSFTDSHAPPTKLILLNLWGCHNLTDAAASRMTNLPHLRSLCVSECHRLTDRFVLGITQSLPQLLHLQLRYLRRITDASLESIASRMTGLYSLDVSFCTKLTIGGLAQLVRERCTSLSELRLYSCRQLDVEGGSVMDGGRNNGGNGRGVGGGCRLVQALRSLREVSILSFLDLRECQQQDPFVRDDLFLNGMAELGFDEALRGLFVRPARWNGEVRRQLVANLSDAGGLMV